MQVLVVPTRRLVNQLIIQIGRWLSKCTGPVLIRGNILWQDIQYFVASCDQLRAEECLLVIHVVQLVSFFVQKSCKVQIVVPAPCVSHEFFELGQLLHAASAPHLAEGHPFKVAVQLVIVEVVPSIDLHSNVRARLKIDQLAVSESQKHGSMVVVTGRHKSLHVGNQHLTGEEQNVACIS